MPDYDDDEAGAGFHDAEFDDPDREEDLDDLDDFGDEEEEDEDDD